MLRLGERKNTHETPCVVRLVFEDVIGLYWGRACFVSLVERVLQKHCKGNDVPVSYLFFRYRWLATYSWHMLLSVKYKVSVDYCQE